MRVLVLFFVLISQPISRLKMRRIVKDNAPIGLRARDQLICYHELSSHRFMKNTRQAEKQKWVGNFLLDRRAPRQ